MKERKLNPIIYKTTNLVNGKIYIGQDRYNNPKYLGSGTALCNAIKKYRRKNFKKEILEQCTLEELNEREVYWITFYDSMNPEVGYNLTSGGKQRCFFSEESKKKISDGNKGKIRTEEFKNKQRQNRHSDEAKILIGLAAKGRTKSDITKQKLSDAHKGKSKKYIVWNKGKHQSAETKEKIRIGVLLNIINKKLNGKTEDS